MKLRRFLALLLVISMLGAYLPAGAGAEEVCDHDYSHWTYAPTCTEEGYTYHQCNLCGHTYSDNIVPAKGHTPDIPEPTETEYQRCTECLKVIDYLYLTGDAGQGVTFYLDRDGTMTFSGTGDIEKVIHGHLDEARVTKIIINEGIVFIRDNALPVFPNLTSISFPNTLEAIGEAAFDQCANLTDVEFPDSLERIGVYAFQLCHGLTELSFPEHTVIERWAFADCHGLKKVVLPKNGRTGDEAFARCTNLTDAEIHGTPTRAVFLDCTALKNVTIGSDVPSLEGNIFGNCTALTSVHIPGNVKTMSYTFRGCYNLKDVTMDYGVERIGDRTFSDCRSLESIVIPASVTEIRNSVFYVTEVFSKLTSIRFEGCAPVFDSKALHGLGHSTICYYPSGNSTWNSETLKPHGSTTARWQPYAHTHSYVSSVTEPDCKNGGYTEHTCSGCHYSYRTDEKPALGHSMSGGVCTRCGAESEVNVEYFGRDALAAMDNAVALLYAYDRIVEGVASEAASFSVYDGVHVLSAAELSTVLDVYDRDHTNAFWISGWSYSMMGGNVLSVSPVYTVSGGELAAAKAAVEAEVNEILSGISLSMSDYEKELYLHDTLAARIEYVEASNAHNIYGALVEGLAVCEGYAEAFQYLLQRCGIQSFIMTGSSKGVAHAWNAVKIGGKFYHVDVTWDDQGEDLYHAYFNLTDARLSEDHSIYGATFALPVCNSEDAFYFTGKDTLLTTYDATTVGKLLKEHNGKVHVYIPGDMGSFLSWFGNNILAIAQAAGVTGGFSYGYNWLSREVILVIPELQTECSHSYNTATLAPDCVTPGLAIHTCILCGHSYEEVIPETGHSHDSVVTPPTCTAEGYTTHTCHCGDSYVDSYTPMVDHSYGAWETVTDATCTDDGEKKQTCSVCGDTKTAVIPAEGHTEVTDKAVAATCTATGLTEGKHCSVCNAVLVAQIVIPTKDHSWNAGEITKAPTEESQGEKTYTCTACGETRTETIPALDHVHDYKAVVTAPTCTEKGYTTHTCRCGDSYIDSHTPVIDHSYGAWETVTDATCTDDGEKKQTCSSCGDTRTAVIVAEGHTEVTDKAVAATCTATGLTEGKHCSICNEVLVAQIVIPVKAHTPNLSAPTEEEDQVCTVCGTVLAPATGHICANHLTFVAAKAATCTEDGNIAHYLCTCGKKYEDASASKLLTAVVIPATGHNHVPVVTAPTCTAEGYTTHTCHCGDSYIDSYTPVVDHSYGAWTVDVESTCTSVGTGKRECTACGNVETRELPMREHIYSETVTAPNCIEQGYTTFRCMLCGYSYKDKYVMPNGNHTYSGLDDADCDVCGAVRDLNDILVLPFTEAEWEVLKLTNKHREAAGLPPLTGYALLQKAGHIRAEELVQYYSHTRPNGTSCFTVLDELGIRINGICAENIAYGYRTPASVVNAWMNSQGHRENILNPDLGHMTAGNVGTNWVQMFTGVRAYTDIQVFLPEALSVDLGVTIEELGLVAILTNSKTGECYLPLSDSHCTGYDPNVTGDQTVTVSVLGVSTGFAVHVHDWQSGGCVAEKLCALCGKTEGAAGSHSFGEWTVVAAPTCTEKGIERRDCATCDHYETHEIAPEGHTEVVDNAIAPTCTEDGLTEGKHCSVCNEILVAQIVIPAKDHSWNAGEITKAPTEESQGEKTYTCTACGETKKETIPALDHVHDYKAVVTAPTCTEKGYTTHTCRCGDSYVDSYTPVVDHSYGAWEVVTDATCTDDGEKKQTCSACGDTRTAVIPAEGHTEVTDKAVAATCTTTGLTEGKHCSVCNEVLVAQSVIPAKDHSWNAGEITKAPTEESQGEKTFTCTACGETKKETIPALDHVHDYKAVVTAPTCTEKGYTTHTCRCGDSYIDSYTPVVDHSYGAWEVVTDVTCTDDGEKKQTCSACGDTRTAVIVAEGHTEVTDKAVAATCTATGLTEGKHCSVCGEILVKQNVIPVKAHTPNISAPAEEEDQVCTVCGTVLAPATGHICANHLTFRAEVAATCTEDGNIAYYLCTCGKRYEDASASKLLTAVVIPATGHNHVPVVTAPTCTAEGYTTHTCHCGDSYVDGYTPVVDHSYGAWEVVTDATCTEKGEKKQACTVCGDTRIEVIPAKGHSWDGNTCTVCGEVQTGNRIELDAALVADAPYAWVDGKKYPITISGDKAAVSIPNTDATNLVIYTFNDPNAADIHTQYPTGMMVWILKYENGAYTANYVPEFDNLLQYSGSSIRIVGVKGIRMITSIDKDTRNALINGGLAGYTLVEYGTALAWVSDLDENNPLVLGRDYTKSNFAYKRGEADPIFARTGNLIQYTNVLVGFNDDQCIPDIAMRPYIILEDAEGQQITIYGGEVERSIGYIAWQNRNVFQPGTTSYDYVWGIIHHVYGDQFDEDYKG